MTCLNISWLYSAPLDYLEKQQFILQVTFMSSDFLISSQTSEHQMRTGVLNLRLSALDAEVPCGPSNVFASLDDCSPALLERIGYESYASKRVDLYTAQMWFVFLSMLTTVAFPSSLKLQETCRKSHHTKPWLHLYEVQVYQNLQAKFQKHSTRWDWVKSKSITKMVTKVVTGSYFN